MEKVITNESNTANNYDDSDSDELVELIDTTDEQSVSECSDHNLSAVSVGLSVDGMDVNQEKENLDPTNPLHPPIPTKLSCDSLKNLESIKSLESLSNVKDNIHQSKSNSSAETRVITRKSSMRKPRYASNTIIATNGLVYQFEPFQLPPPGEIAALFNELRDRRGDKKERSMSMTSSGSMTSLQGLLHGSERSQSSRELGSGSGLGLGRDTQGVEETKQTVPPPSSSDQELEQEQEPAEYKSVLRKRRGSPSPCTPSGKEESRSKRVSIHSPLTTDKYDRLVNDPEESEKDKNEKSDHNDECFIFFDFSLLQYLYGDIFGSHIEPGQEEHTAHKVIKKFITVPLYLERLLFFGFFVSCDAFLFTITFLPIRCLTSLFLLINESIMYLTNNKIKLVYNMRFHRSNLYDMMRGLLLVVGCYALTALDMSRVYHLIRQQTLIKLYVMTAMLEICDKLLCSFGQDAWASLYLQTSEGPTDVFQMATIFIVVCVYVVVHATLYFINTCTVTVAANSSDQAFLSLILLNNFAEIKSFVFKKFDKQNLFQLSCADITERFQTNLFMSLIIAASLAQADSPWREMLPAFFWLIGLMLTGEAVADWVKHCFITKFNSIESTCYDDYARILRGDILSCHSMHGRNLDPTYSVTRRIGLAQVPLACVLVRYVILVLTTPWASIHIQSMTWPQLVRYAIFCFLLVVLFKVLLGITLIFYCGYMKNRELAIRKSKGDYQRSLQRQKSVARLANIERYTVIKGRIQG
mmetsp:Transcript_35984/g.36666  ORF Transcript_35984/g.36666 Transcript_35984/m.36666 type:complete len:754 (-) Transcript_35984:111-2372(-)